MALDHFGAVDGILGALKTLWDSQSAAVAGQLNPVIMVYEDTEPDLKPHPRDDNVPWARAVIRHGEAMKVTLQNSDRLARYRRRGLVWVQVFVPQLTGADASVAAIGLAKLAQKAYEGKRTGPDGVVFTTATIQERPRDGAFRRADCKATFYWDEIK